MLDIGTELDGGDITFGSLADGIVVAQRHPGVWSVSFRPNPDGIGMRYYTAPAVVARVVIAREHDETAAGAPPNRGRVGADGRPVPRHGCEGITAEPAVQFWAACRLLPDDS